MENDQTEGFIKLYRKFVKSDFWTKKREFSKAEAWIDLLFLGQYRTTSKVINGKSVDIRVGEIYAARSFLAERWGWGEQKVRTYLKNLEKTKRITKRLTNGVSILNICKYEIYNSGTPKNNQITSQNTQNSENITSDITKGATPLSGYKCDSYEKDVLANNQPTNLSITSRQPEEEERKESKEINKGKRLPCSILNFLGDEFKCSEAFCEAWAEWEEYRKQRKLKAWVELTCKKKAEEFTSWGVKRTVEAISTAIASNWAGIFPPKEDKAKSKGLSLKEFRDAYRWNNNIFPCGSMDEEAIDKKILNADLNTLQTKYKTIYNELSEQASETFGALRKFLNKRKI